MATEAELKAAIDADITDKVLDNSVTQVNVGENMKATVDFTVQEVATNRALIQINTDNIVNVQDNLTNEISTVDSELALCTKNADPDVSANIWVLDEDDMSSDSNTKVPTQQSVKSYVDAKIPLIGTVAPLSASDTGIYGEIRVTATYIYFCIATDTWVRSVAATW